MVTMHGVEDIYILATHKEEIVLFFRKVKDFPDIFCSPESWP